ncbi:MAG: polyphosphate kinase 2 family protein [Bacteroidetes bacterium]|nr:polyphosphate kinase 2 family protein [Bacteroidota bacterium]
MESKIKIEDFRYAPGKSANLSKIPTEIPDVYKNKDEYEDLMGEYTEKMQSLQDMLYAYDRYSLLLIFQGMDTAGKDGAIKHVMSGINVTGVQVFTFKRPSDMELDHDWMWRTTCCLPERGRIGIFNRSYYEEVLVVKVHPEILRNYQRIPKDLIADENKIWEDRYKDIINFEDFQHRNGCRVVKFFLNISKEEQKRRLLDRIDQPEKNWKMSLQDVEERKDWEKYMDCYQELLDKTSSPNSPWYVIPANDKKNARLIISRIILGELKSLDMHFPEVTDEFRAKLKAVKDVLDQD